MAMPPVIPTSFVPHPAAGGGGPRSSPLGLGSVLNALAFFLLILALISAGGVFIYGNILDSQKSAKDAALAKAESSIDQSTIEGLVQLRDRLTSAQTLLNNHVALSGLFDLLGSVTPSNATFSSVSIAADNTGHLTLSAAGTAKSFNTLAATSNDFGASSGLKNTIFSNLAINANGTVSFSLNATLDPTLVAYTGVAAPAPVAPAGSTSTTTKP